MLGTQGGWVFTDLSDVSPLGMLNVNVQVASEDFGTYFLVILPLVLNTITQLIFVAEVHKIASQVSPHTVTLVLVIRKAIQVSLIISILHGRPILTRELHIGLDLHVVVRLLGVPSRLGVLEMKFGYTGDVYWGRSCTLWHHWIYDSKSTT
jgi:hypothetical protein